jgi:hypothetical protein
VEVGLEVVKILMMDRLVTAGFQVINVSAYLTAAPFLPHSPACTPPCAPPDEQNMRAPCFREIGRPWLEGSGRRGKPPRCTAGARPAAGQPDMPDRMAHGRSAFHALLLARRVLIAPP